MRTARLIPAVIFLFFLFCGTMQSIACSMCKVTVNGRTYVGNNEDSWRMGSRIWFETAKPGQLGCVYVGYDAHPQGGMNEAGLAFDGLALYPKPVKNDPQKKEITNATAFLKQIMQTCRTADDVKRFAVQYNRQKFFNNGEYMFVDRAGNYVVMEQDTLVTGHDDKYLLANFCPSNTSENDKMSGWERYKRGRLFLTNHPTDIDSNSIFALTDTMHECRARIGGGTMYSWVADLEKTDFTVFFYHDFKHPIRFNLQQELLKGDHELKMASAFPANKEYLRFINIQTPRNNVILLLMLFAGGAWFAFSFFYFLIGWLRKRNKDQRELRAGYIRFLIAAVSAVMLYYMTVLYKDEGAYFASAPFTNFQFSLHDIAAYIPFMLLVCMIPMIKMNIQIWKRSYWSFISKSIFTADILFFAAFIGVFFYWGLYSFS